MSNGDALAAQVRSTEGMMTMNMQGKTMPNRVVMTLTRIFNAPCDVVFKAWTDPKQLAQWWGPKSFTNPVCEIDVRPGGKMLIHMQAPDGTVYPMTGKYLEIVEPHRLVFNCEAVDLEGSIQIEELAVISFEAIGNKTRLTVFADAIGVAPIAPSMLSGMEMGWAQSLDRLGENVEG